MKRNPIIEPIFIILLGITIIIFSTHIETVVESIAIGPDFMPTLIGVIFVLLGLGLVPEAVKKQRVANLEKTTAAPHEKVVLSKKEFALKYMHFIIWGLALIYALLMNSLGFLFDSIGFLFIAMVLLTIKNEKRNWVAIIVISIVVPLFVYVLFRQRFYLMLPMGVCKYIPLKILR